MPVDPLAIIFDQVSLMTGGLITDMTTVVLGIIAVTFILIGLDILLTIMQNPIANFQRGRAAAGEVMNSYRMSRLPSAPSSVASRSDVEISPLRQGDLDPFGSLESGPDATYANNHWERDGVDLPEDRYLELEQALDGYTPEDYTRGER